MKEIIIDFSKKIKPMKAVNGVNCAPYVKSEGANQRLIKEYFSELHTPYSRTHDCMGIYGGTYFIDVPNIFRDFDADESDEKNYDFYYTDEYLKGIIDAGTQIVYRLGITIEWGSKKYRTFPPKDNLKWAKICEHIIMHYNEGWANGFRYGIEYFEIWNEPENPPMWSGTMEEFFDLYKTAATYLKGRFSKIKVGGYGSCGFYAITSRKGDAFYESFITWFHEFLKKVTTEKIPLDFYSWHLYTDDFDEFTTHVKYVRETLDKYGLKNTESHFNEWNVGGEGGGFHLMRNMTGASYIAAVLCELQNTDYVDKAMYYVFDLRAGYNGLLDQNLLTKTCTYYALKAFGDCYALKTQTFAESEEKRVRVVAASDGKRKAAVIADYDATDGEYLIKIKGLNKGEKLVFTEIKENGSDTETVVAAGDTAERKMELKRRSVISVSSEL